MRTLFRVLLPLLLTGSLAGSAAPKISPPPTTFVIGISPFLEPAVKDEVYRNIVRLIVEGLPLDSKIAIFDAFNLRSVTQVTVPNLQVFDSPKTRANQFAPAIRELKSFLAQEKPKPGKPPLNLAAAILLPQFCDFLAENYPSKDSSLRVLLIGSPLYQDTKEPAFSMVDGYFPSDGHLLASRDKSVYGSRADADDVPRLSVHWAYFGDPWVSDLHKEKITRFWALYLERRGGRLKELSGDLATVAQAFREGRGEDGAATRRWTMNREQTKVEMLRISRDVPVNDWLMGDLPSNMVPSAPAALVGPMRIGIRWNQNVDLDLYAIPHAGAETLFFQHPESPEGYYYKDHRHSPGREFEFVEFSTPVDARQVEASVNFYQGSLPHGPRGEVRIEFDGRIYSAPFSIEATEGNLARSGHSQQRFWTKIPIQQILRIASEG
jgi:hypothetical protein